MFESLSIAAILSLVLSLVLSLILIPKILWIVKVKNLIDHPDHRSSHLNSTPTMAGVAFFLTLLFIASLISPWDTQKVGINLLSALGLMFAVGLKDDLMVSTPKAKLGSEILAIFFILFCNCLHVTSLNGFLGIHDIPLVISYGFIILLILTIINSFNMIDGIDGLASGIGIVIFSIYSIIFYSLEFHYYFLLSLSLIGILLGFLRFNLSKKYKIFMGDTGSLIIGFCIGFLTIKFLSVDATLLEAHHFNPENSVVLFGAIFFIPLFDTIRIIGVRLINKKSPFGSDHNHIHHILIKLGLSHLKASLFLSSLNLGIAILFFYLSTIFNSLVMVGLYIVSFILLLGVFYNLKKIQINP